MISWAKSCAPCLISIQTDLSLKSEEALDKKMQSGWRVNCLLTTFSYWNQLHTPLVWQMAFGTRVSTQQEWQLGVCRTHSHFPRSLLWETDVFAMQPWLNPAPKGRPGYRLQGLTGQSLLSWPRVVWNIICESWAAGKFTISICVIFHYPLIFFFFFNLTALIK